MLDANSVVIFVTKSDKYLVEKLEAPIKGYTREHINHLKKMNP